MASIIQNNFTGGIISPSLRGRSDLAAYYKGVADAENYIVGKVGTLVKRRGIVASEDEALSTLAAWRIFPYKYDRTRGGFLLVGAETGGDVKCRLFTKGLERIAEEATLYEASGGEDLSFFEEMQATQIGDTIFISCEAFLRRVVVNDFTGECTLAVTAFEQAEAPEKPSISTSTNFETLNYTEYYCAVVEYKGRFSKFATAAQQRNKTWAAGKHITVSVRPPKIGNDYDTAGETWDRILVGKKSGANYGELTSFYPEDFQDRSATLLTFTDENIAPGAMIAKQYDVLHALDAGFAPRCVNAFQQRLVFANAETKDGKLPTTLWFSETANLYNFWSDRPVNADDPFSAAIFSQGPAFVRHLASFNQSLIAFTDCGIFEIASGDAANGFSASTCRIAFISDVCPSARVAPIPTPAGIIFVGSDDKTLYTISYDLATDSKRPVNRSILAPHLTAKTRIISIAQRQYPDNVIFATLESGEVLAFTFQEEQEVFAWSRITLGEGWRVKETIGLGTVTDEAGHPTYGDIALVIENTLDGTEHLAKLAALGSEAAYSDTLPGEVAPVHVDAHFTTLAPESQERSITGMKKRIIDVLVKLNESGTLEVASASGQVAAQALNRPNGQALATGDFKVVPRGYIDELGQMTFRSTDGKRSEVLAVFMEVDVERS